MRRSRWHKPHRLKSLLLNTNARPPKRTGIHAKPIVARLENNLEGELDFPRLARQQRDRSDSCRRSIRVKYTGVAVAAAGLRRNEVVVVEDVEHLGPELNVKLFRDALDREILAHGEVHIVELRTRNAVPPNIERRQIGAVCSSRGIGQSRKGCARERQ